MKIIIAKVEQVAGKVLSNNWEKDMVVITAEDGHKFIDNLPGKKHSKSARAWYGYDNWNDLKGTEVNIVVTDDWGNVQHKLSTEAQYNIWAKHPDARMVR